MQQATLVSKSARPPKPILFSPVKRGIKRLMLTTIDKGWFGLRPLQTHIVICGFHRSGSTLLLLILETCVSDAKKFGKEKRALSAAHYPLRNHPFMITKKPDDIIRMDEIREFYASRKAQVRFILTTRDPRAILTSHHAALGEKEYVVTPELWRATYNHFHHACQFDDVVTVMFEDLVTQPDKVQARLTEFIGWNVHHPFDQFHTAIHHGFSPLSLSSSLILMR